MSRSPAWQALAHHADRLMDLSLSDLVLDDPRRLQDCAIELDGLSLNYALQFIDRQTLPLLFDLARQQKLESWRGRMYGGEKINVSENRAALHIALRQQGDAPLMFDGRDIIKDVKAVRRQMTDFTQAVRSGAWKGHSGQPMTDILHIGIGGSDLGPRLVVAALAPYTSGLKVHYVANADAFELLPLLKILNPATTLFIVVSKTFTTQETLLNARTARQWLVAALGEAAVARHFVAASVNPALVKEFGILEDHIFPMPDWVGGRFSLWSAVGLSIELAIGPENFDALLAGAAAMDDHFFKAPLDKNMPVVLAMLGIWCCNFLGAPAYGILPYSERLRDLPRFLQQLEMESNGKTITRDGQAVDYTTAPVIFGECGTVGQHSFHQWLHQGSQILPVDFIGVAQDQIGQPEHHKALLSNMAAQAGALAFGQLNAASLNDIYPGNRPSTILIMDRLDPQRLGMLLALFEHKVFVQGVIWNINSFDQPGVELGKRLARGLAAGAETKDGAGRFMADLYRKIAFSA